MANTRSVAVPIASPPDGRSDRRITGAGGATAHGAHSHIATTPSSAARAQGSARCHTGLGAGAFAIANDDVKTAGLRVAGAPPTPPAPPACAEPLLGTHPQP